MDASEDVEKNISDVEGAFSEAKEEPLYQDSSLHKAYEYQVVEAGENAAQAQLITSILENYKRQQSQRYGSKSKKQDFIFWFLMALLGILTVGIAVWIGLLFGLHQTIATSEVIGLITSCITYLSSLLTVFFVIVKYVFPKDEEKNFNDLVSNIIKNHTDRLKNEYDYLIKRDERK